jgi:hypothetical protein
MNINLTVQCEDCDNITNCRVGMSNRDIQPLKFSCKGCGSPIGLTFGRMALKRIDGAIEVEGVTPFDNQTDFVDLHLDFPLVFGKYVMGNTPYFQALHRVGHQNAEFHRQRLELINQQYKKYPTVERLIAMFTKGHFGPFRRFTKERFRVETKSEKPADINAALYTILSFYVLPYTLPDTSSAIVQRYTTMIMSLLQKAPNESRAFLKEISDSTFLQRCQTDCLRIYKPILAAELPLRPALFLDLDSSYVEGQTAMRVSTNDFEEYREVYKDMAELLSRLLVLVAGLNNLINRNKHNEFAKGVHVSNAGKELAPKTLDAFADVVLANKPKFLDNCWFSLNPIAHDNKLRNAIAHNKIDYDELTQRITYYPKLEGMGNSTKHEIQLLDYMRRMLALFRECHRLHHLVKCLNYAVLLNPGGILSSSP